MQHELGCAESWHGRAVGSFPLTMWLPRKYRPSELSMQEKPRQMGKEGYTINTSSLCFLCYSCIWAAVYHSHHNEAN